MIETTVTPEVVEGTSVLVQVLTSAGIAVLVANLLTMFVDESKFAKYGVVVQALLGFLNTVSLNIFKNTNVTAVKEPTE